MHKRLIPLIALLFFLGCERYENPYYISFRNKKLFYKDGIPTDSTSSYFPKSFYTDTIHCILNGKQIFRLDQFLTKEKCAKNLQENIEQFRDTFKVFEDSTRFKMQSYTLYKMQEPILSDHYLSKDVYRILVLRSFNPPLSIRIENTKGKISLFMKRLNKQIMFPFIVYDNNSDSVFYCSPDIAYFDSTKNKTVIRNKMKYDKLLIKNKNWQDSVAKVKNIVDYKIVEERKIELRNQTWDSLMLMIDSTNFWTTKPELALDYLQIDGSRWLFEGHTKKGYQIKIVLSPFLEKNDYTNEMSYKYAKIFRYLINLSEVKNEYLY
jgi:hypothetical protein